MARAMKQRLVTTDARLDMFLREFDHKLNAGRPLGLDTEAVGPARRYSQARANPFLNMGYAAIQGISIGFANENVYYFPLRHKGPNSKWAWAERAMAELKDRPVWAHNVKFDAGLLEKEGFDIEGIFWRDSMLAAWLAFSRNDGISLKKLALELLERESPEWEGSLIDKTAEQVKDYVCHDALNTLQVGEHLYHEKLTKKQQDALVTIETPFAIELSRMATMGKLAHTNSAGLLKKWNALAPDANPNSAKSLQEFFIDGTWEPYGTTKAGVCKTGRDVMEYNEKHARTEDGRRLARLCLDLRAARKVEGTYLDGFYEEIRQWPDRRLHPELLQLGTRTGRLSSSNPNIQNQLSKGEYAPLLKQCYVADDGWQFVSADYAQIELRLFAELAGNTLLQSFIDGADLHQRTADALGEDRNAGKTFNFGFLIYGGGPQKAAREFNWTVEQAKENIKAIAAEYPEAQAIRDRIIKGCISRSPVPFVRTRTGRVRYIPELKPLDWKRRDPEAYEQKAKYVSSKYNINREETIGYGQFAGWLVIDKVIRSAGERIAVNTPIQGSAADIAKLAMVNFAASTCSSNKRLVTMVHDEILCTAKDVAAEDCANTLKHHMEAAGPALGYKVPIIAEPAIGKTWYDVH
jgi:DNA polymerase-1